MAINGDVLGIVSDLQRRTEQYRKPARIMPTFRASEIDQLRKSLATERGLRNDLERELAKITVANERLKEVLATHQIAVEVTSTGASVAEVMCAFVHALNLEGYLVDGDNYTKAHLTSALRAPRYSEPRQVCMWLCVRITKKSTPIIGHAFHRDHSTVLAAVNRGPEIIEDRAILRRASDRTIIQYGAAE